MMMMLGTGLHMSDTDFKIKPNPLKCMVTDFCDVQYETPNKFPLLNMKLELE